MPKFMDFHPDLKLPKEAGTKSQPTPKLQKRTSLVLGKWSYSTTSRGRFTVFSKRLMQKQFASTTRR